MIQNASAALFDVEDSFVNSKSKEIEQINASQTSPLTNNCEYEIDLAENRYEFCSAVVEKRKTIRIHHHLFPHQNHLFGLQLSAFVNAECFHTCDFLFCSSFSFTIFLLAQFFIYCS